MLRQSLEEEEECHTTTQVLANDFEGEEEEKTQNHPYIAMQQIIGNLVLVDKLQFFNCMVRKTNANQKSDALASACNQATKAFTARWRTPSYGGRTT